MATAGHKTTYPSYRPDSSDDSVPLQVSNSKLSSLPAHVIAHLINTLVHLPNDTTNFSGIHVRRSMQSEYPIYVCLFVIVIVLGSLASSVMTIKVIAVIRCIHSTKMDVFSLNSKFNHEALVSKELSDNVKEENVQVSKLNDTMKVGHIEPITSSNEPAWQFLLLHYMFMCSVSISNCIMCLLVMPVSLAILILQNWVFGRTFCFLAPLIQVIC